MEAREGPRRVEGSVSLWDETKQTEKTRQYEKNEEKDQNEKTA